MNTVLRRLRRPAALLAPLLLVSGLLSSCGSGEDAGVLGDAEERLDAVSISGDFGEEPEVEWESRMTAGDPVVEVPVTGDGEELAADDQVLLEYYVGNGFTEQTSLSTFGDQPVTSTLPVGGEPAQPTDTEDPELLARYLLEAFVLTQIEPGDTVGTRKVITANSSDIVGFTGFGLDIGNDDGLLFVVDILDKADEAPSGQTDTPEAWVPAIDIAQQRPSALDFTQTPPPADFLRVDTLIEGEGEPLAADDLVAVRYLGQTYDGGEPFDGNYDAPGLFVFKLGSGAVIQGWDRALEGVPTGSRVMLAIPPRLGYGQQGSPQAGIEGDDTLYFVIDVLAAG